MPSVPAGQRSWKCPECGGEVLLSVSQLDPIACDACLSQMKNAGGSVIPTIPMASPLGFWTSLGETTKLAAVAIALVIGLAIGYVAGSSKSSPASSAPHHSATRSKETAPVEQPSSQEESTSDSDSEKRPEPPGPGYHWVKGRKHKDGTYGTGHWAKDPKSSDAKGAP